MKKLNHKDTFIYGIGNSARQDDGLGWAFLDQLKETGIFKGEIHYCYQLNIEDAEVISKAENVIFVDSFAGDLPENCKLEKCEINGEITFTTHALNPEAVLALTKDVYDKTPNAYVLKIKGYKWELEEGLSNEGKRNLNQAIKLISDLI